MEGITILNEYTPDDYENTIVVVVIMCITIIVLGMFMCFELGYTGTGIIVFIVGIAITILIGLLIKANLKENVETHYQIIIDRDVNFKEFTNKYEVIDKKGDIYTVKLKESE